MFTVISGKAMHSGISKSNGQLCFFLNSWCLWWILKQIFKHLLLF